MTRFPMATAIAAAMTAVALISMAEVASHTSCVSKLVPCLGTLNMTTKLSKVCCDSVKEALQRDLRCLCTINTNVTTTQALNLTRRCNIHTDLHRCSALGAPSPKASLSPYPGFGSPSPRASFPPRGQAAQVKPSRKLIIILGASAASTVIIIIVIVVVVKTCNARKEIAITEIEIPRANRFNPSILLREYDYSQVKKMTNSLDHKLGEGSYGIVYKGKLAVSSRDVAVKILKNPKKEKSQFNNEVLSLARTSHGNVVSLLGFCHDGNNTALVYEHMPNGSLNQLICSYKPKMMALDKSYAIVLGVSRGLEYLHNGCGRRIVHFDIKPDNILMDKDFRPKIADFGLAKLCKGKESIMSMLDSGGGTPGYIAPEIFSRNYGVSYKADVHSFGMVVLEMMGLRKAADPGSNNSSVYFPNFIYEDFETGEIVRMFGDEITEEEEKIAKKMVLVGLWCIQTNPSHRPAMAKVIEMLEGHLEDIDLPPKPQPLSVLPVLTVAEILDGIDETSSSSNPNQVQAQV